MLEISQEQQRNHIRDLSESGGWKVLEYRINELLNSLKTRLELEKDLDEIRATQGMISSLRFVIRQVEESKGRQDNEKK